MTSTDPTGPKSVPPRGAVTWPMVGYVFVKELPYVAMVAAGAVVGVVLLLHAPSATYEPILSVVAPAVIAALGRSQPANTLPGG